VSSLVLLLLYAENVVPKLMKHGILGGICHPSVFEDPSFIFYGFLNYILKYAVSYFLHLIVIVIVVLALKLTVRIYELADTVLLALKKKDLTVLHVFHHTMTLLLTFVQLHGHTSVVLNISVQ
jgi:fatty acid elongase 3